ncbi:MAG: GTPase Era [Deltaproteobacteria bacterium RIFCSPLOWO2_02_FULL_50_16]|nr:MAG: GTPase Era [Deltaproteobacteria bacterium RIFCSPLOWO2_02_FULL_50_16]
MTYKSGYVALLGRPNVGKSTLMNALVGEPVAIVTSKPQTTRNKILGIKTLPQGQILFLDTPGLHKPHRELNEYMMKTVEHVVADADIFVYVIEATRGILDEDRDMLTRLRSIKKPLVIVISKADLAGLSEINELSKLCVQDFQPVDILSTNALARRGIEKLEEILLQVLPEGPPYYAKDIFTDQNYRDLACEIIREKAFELLRQEVPYSLVVSLEDYREPREGEKVTRIEATIVVERESQKGIVIGVGGLMIKKIGEKARKKIEDLIGSRVFLGLKVIVDKDWSHSEAKLKKYGYISSR